MPQHPRVQVVCTEIRQAAESALRGAQALQAGAGVAEDNLRLIETSARDLAKLAKKIRRASWLTRPVNHGIQGVQSRVPAPGRRTP